VAAFNFIGAMATIAMVINAAAVVTGSTSLPLAAGVALWALVVFWALAWTLVEPFLVSCREWCDDALRVPRSWPTDWANPSSLIGLAFKGVAEPNETVACEAVHVYLGRRLEDKESVVPVGQHEAVLRYDGAKKTHEWKFSLAFKQGRDELSGEPFVWISAAHVYAL